MAHQGLDISTWFAYMENIARMHTGIAHDPDNGRRRYARMHLDEWLSAAQTKLDGAGYCLLVEHYETGVIDRKSNNIMAERMVAWTVVRKVEQKGDWTTSMTYETGCEDRAWQILARLRRDRLNYADQKFADVLVDEAEGQTIPAAVNGAWVGYRVMVPVQNVERRIVYDGTLWDDDLAEPTDPEASDGDEEVCRYIRVCGTPTTGQVVYYNGTSWVPFTLDTTTDRDFATNPGYETIDIGGGVIRLIPLIDPDL